MSAGKRILRRTFLAQLQVSIFFRLGDIEGQSKNNKVKIESKKSTKKDKVKIEIRPNTPPIPPHVVRVYAPLYKGYQ